jgi:hypothetical protein
MEVENRKGVGEVGMGDGGNGNLGMGKVVTVEVGMGEVPAEIG